MMTSRTPYIVKARCYLNGADITSLLFIKSRNDATDAIRRYFKPHERNSFRILECRPATANEVIVHKTRIAAL